MRHCNKIFGLICTAIILTFMVMPAFAQGGSWVVVSRQAGTVESRLKTSTTWLRISNNRRLGTEDSVRTAADGAARLRLADNSIMAMGPNTNVVLKEFTLNSMRRDVNVNLNNGKVRSQVAKHRGRESRFQITSPNAVMAAQGTDYSVIVENGGEDLTPEALNEVVTKVSVFSGRVAVTNRISGFTIIINAGQTGIVTGKDKPKQDPPSFTYTQSEQEISETEGLNSLQSGGDSHLQTPLTGDGRGTTGNTGLGTPTGMGVSTKNPSGEENAGEADVPIQITPGAEKPTTGNVIIDISPFIY